MKLNQQQKDSAISTVCTVVIMAIAVVLCAWMGYWPPDPPIEEEGMGVAGEVLGEIEGFGNNDMADFDDNSSAPSASSASSNESYTTATDPSPVVKENRTDVKPVSTPNTETSKNTTSDNSSSEVNNNNVQPTLNSNLTFKGRNKSGNNEGKGDANGSGQEGQVDGTKGASGGSGHGVGVEIGGMGNRRVRGTVPIPDQKKEYPDGTVVVRIKVDRQGNVVDVEAPVKGSVNQTAQMVEAAKTAAKRAHFTADSDAPEFQYGTIKYQFRKRG